MNSSILFKPFLMWTCVALFYLYQFILRVSPSIMVDELMLHFRINATDTGMLAAISMYCYSLFQIPSGFLTDLWGVRKVVLGSILLCIFGTLIFVSTDQFWIAGLGRAFLGVGSAAAFLCVSKVSSLWFSPNRRSTLLGMTMAIGTVGAWNGSNSLSQLVTCVGWQKSLLGVSSLGCVILGIAFAFLKDKKEDSEADQLENKSISAPDLSSDLSSNLLSDLSKDGLYSSALLVLKSRTCWQYAIVALGIYLSITVIADLWGVSFLMATYAMGKQKAAQTTSFIYIGLCAGSLSLTFLADLLNRKIAIIRCSLIGLLCTLGLVIYETHFSPPVLALLFFMIGFFSGAEMLCFSSALDHFSNRLAGTVTGFINGIVMLGGAVIQQQTGRLLDLAWGGGFKDEGIRLYSLQEYQSALSLTVMAVFISCLFSVTLSGKVTSKKRGNVS